jgi:hypothetical protein
MRYRDRKEVNVMKKNREKPGYFPIGKAPGF